MDTIFTNSDNEKASVAQILLLHLSDKINLKSSDKHVALLNLSSYFTWKKIQKSYKNKAFKISAPICNEKFEIPDG